MDQDGTGPVEPREAAEYVSDLSGQLGAIAAEAGLTQTAALLLRAQASARAEVMRLQLEKAAPEDAA